MTMNKAAAKHTRAIRSVAAALCTTVLLSVHLAAETVYPAEMSKDDIAGGIFDNPETVVSEQGTVLDITSLLSSDGKFASGMYRAGPSRWKIDEPYGVDEFMLFLEGGVTLTSSDGTVTEIEAGEAVTIPKEWTGIWETDGYMKIWVIYSEDGSALE
jgi:uncharacterized cupin superfamily protein